MPDKNDENERLGCPRLAARHAMWLGVFTLVFGGMLFCLAGTLNWPMAWVYLGLGFVGIVVTWVLLARVHPDLLVERSHFGEGAKPWDKVLARLMGVGVLVPTLLVAGLDHRWAWSPKVPLSIEITAVILFALGMSWVSWAMLSNRFFAPVVQIQRDRGHTVVTAGPYGIVRHPGYLGIVLCQTVVPLMLGSYWAMIPAGAGWIVAVVRTALEDRTLQNELEGYREYASVVRYRLIPGIW